MHHPANVLDCNQCDIEGVEACNGCSFMFVMVLVACSKVRALIRPVRHAEVYDAAAAHGEGT